MNLLAFINRGILLNTNEHTFHSMSKYQKEMMKQAALEQQDIAALEMIDGELQNNNKSSEEIT